jgi:hypothetical protein
MLLLGGCVLFVLALVIGALVLWLTGRDEPPRRDD